VVQLRTVLKPRVSIPDWPFVEAVQFSTVLEFPAQIPFRPLSCDWRF
jgi:hypothetical protein